MRDDKRKVVPQSQMSSVNNASGLRRGRPTARRRPPGAQAGLLVQPSETRGPWAWGLSWNRNEPFVALVAMMDFFKELLCPSDSPLALPPIGGTRAQLHPRPPHQARVPPQGPGAPTYCDIGVDVVFLAILPDKSAAQLVDTGRIDLQSFMVFGKYGLQSLDFLLQVVKASHLSVPNSSEAPGFSLVALIFTKIHGLSTELSQKMAADVRVGSFRSAAWVFFVADRLTRARQNHLTVECCS